MCVCVQVNSDGEAMVEVVDGWLARRYPNTPTWREIADVVEQIGYHQLSHSIKQVYVTGGGENHHPYVVNQPIMLTYNNYVVSVHCINCTDMINGI